MLADGRKKFPLEWYKKIGFKQSDWQELIAKPENVIKNLK